MVGVALGLGFALAVTDTGAVFSFGYCPYRTLGHGSLEAEVLPRRIEKLWRKRGAGSSTWPQVNVTASH